MKMSCLPVSLFSDICNGKISIPQWARNAKEIGYDGLDISILFIKNNTPIYIKSLIKDLKDLAMPIIMGTTYSDFTNPDAMQRQREFDYLVRDIALCSQLGIKYLRILAGQAYPEMKVEEGIDHVINNFIKIAHIGEMYNVKLLFENHSKPNAWEYFDFSYPVDIFLKILDGIDNTSIRINFDTGNFVAEGINPLEVIPKIFDKIETIHISDMKEYGKLSPCIIGEGVVPNKEILKLLKEKGFDGWLCIEEASGKALDGIKKAYRFVRDAWDSI